MKNKIQSKILMIILMGLMILPLIKSTKVLASNNLKVMTSSTGSELKYRNSSEKVYGLDQYDYPTAEYRAVWVSTFVGDIPSYTTEAKFKSDANTILDNMVNMGMNAIVFHVRTHNNALYNSDLNPIATWWQNVNFEEFDPLEWLITECHNRGIEFHAWMNPYRVSSSSYVGEAYPAGHPCNNPSLILTNSDGSKILDPGSTIVQDFIVSTCMEFLDRYDADAIHFDDYFYISGVKTELSANQKRANVDAFIEKLSNSIHQMNLEEGRAVQLGISPSGIYQNGNYASSPSYDSNGNLISPIASNTSGFAHYGNYLYSDTKKWIDNEWIDYITPQAYWGMEHTGANFYELTRWWSWCVKYKKVNLYMGIGIYMAESSGSSASYWQRNNDEVKNQLLNAGMYDEIKGTCFYKYSTLLNTSNTIIRNGVNLITNDYWQKRIPGAVIQRYANIIPSIEVSNLNLSGNTLSWNKVDNVFGYMVYQVPKGETLDTSNINHVLEYTQNTQISNIDALTYDYYVSSVNRANVVSNPVKYGNTPTNSYEVVIANINSLPAEITLNDEEKVNIIKSQYDALSTSEQSYVTNYQVLANALSKIAKLKELKGKVDAFLVDFDNCVNSDRILPVGTNMKWSYKNLDDAQKYNIDTGKRLKNYLTEYLMPLYLEITEDGITYKQEVNINLSLLKKGQEGLVYRNDPSCMSTDHEGQYTGTTSYIGWSNATLTIGNQVLFIAVNNFFILNSSEITACDWTSCAGVYYNNSASNVTMTLGQAFSTASPTYGYFIIGSNKQVKVVSSDSPSTASVTLQKGETLVIIRYLDRLITNNPFNPLTVTVGQSAYITNYDEMVTTPEDEAESVVALINTIPSPLSLKDESLVNQIKELYDNLSAEAKTYVTNYNLLENALQEIVSLKETLEALRQEAIASLSSGINLNDYSSDNQIVINNIIKKATNNINNAIDEAEINQIVSVAKGEISLVKTINQELEEYYQSEYQKFVDSVILANYSTTNQGLINSVFDSINEEYENLVTTNQLTKISIDNIFLSAQGKVNQIPTLADELKVAIQNAQAEITSYSELNDYTSSSQAVIDDILYNALDELAKVETIDDVNQTLLKYKALIDEVPTFEEEVNEYRNNATDELETYLSSITDTIEDEVLLNTITELVTSAISQINKETNLNKINNLVDQTKKAIDYEVVKAYANNKYYLLKQEIIFEDYSTSNQELINNLLATIISDITQTTTKDDIDSRVASTTTEIAQIKKFKEELANYQAEAVNEVKSYIDNFHEYETNQSLKNIIDSIVNDAVTSINQKETQEEIDLIVSSAKAQIDYEIVKAYAQEQYQITKAKINFNDYSLDNQHIINQQLDAIKDNISETTTKDEIDKRVQQAVSVISSVQTITDELNQEKVNLNEYLDNLSTEGLTTTQLDALNSLKEEYSDKINNALSLSELKQIKSDIDDSYQNLLNQNSSKQNCSCQAALHIILLITVAVGAIIIRKH